MNKTPSLSPRPRPSSKADLDPAIDEPIARALAPNPDERFTSARAFHAALRAVIEPALPGREQAVIVLYGEGSPAEIAQLSDIALRAGMTIATSAPDSLVAVMGRESPTLSELRTQLAKPSGTRMALGLSTASIEAGGLVDGPALDVESWAPYPVSIGLWVDEHLLL